MKTFSVIFVFLSLLASAQNFEGIKKINGTSIFLSIKGKSKGETLVVLHGGPGFNHGYFKPHLAQLEKKFRIVYFDQRACGKSSIPNPDSISFKFLVDDIEAIRKELKLDKLNFLAHSWAATLVTHYALAYPNRVGKVIYSNGGPLSREYDSEMAALTKKKTSREDSVLRSQLMAGGMMDASRYTQLIKLIFRASAYDRSNMDKLDLTFPPDFMASSNAIFKGLGKDPRFKDNLYDSLKKFSFPALIIHGEADIIPVSSAERMKNNLPKAELVVFKQSGHFPFVEETEKYAEVVSSFVLRKN